MKVSDSKTRQTHGGGQTHTTRGVLSAADDPRWAKVLARDLAADGEFVYAVRTTGVYQRPSSPSRHPHPENVEFFDTSEAAEAAGYRASKRSASDQSSIARQRAALVEAACRT